MIQHTLAPSILLDFPILQVFDVELATLVRKNRARPSKER
jgi:hypothetical protein